MPVLTKINTNSIAEDAITGDKFAGDAYLANTANQNISGTYSESRLYTSDTYTLSGNATVNSHLTLSSIKPTADVVLTAGGAYTLTGTGVLSGGSVVAKANTDLTGMTGEIGSVVTGSPNLNLGNATFSAGSILQIQYSENNMEKSVGGGWTFVDLGVSITPKSSTNKILITTNCQFQYNNSGMGIRIKRGGTVIRQNTTYSNYTSSGGQINTRSTYSIMDSPATTNTVHYWVEAVTYTGTHTWNESSNYSEIIAMEVVA